MHDASLRAFVAVIYLVMETHSRRHVKFIASKTQVSPTKLVTIPRLELLSALLLSRLMHSISGALEQEMSLSTPQCYTDSMVGLHWILETDKSWKPFVQNRVEEIRRLLPPEEWSHCADESNPADLPSRGLTPRQLSQSKLWLEGPVWLRTSSHSDKTETLMPEECYSELRKSKIEKTPILLSIEIRSSGVELLSSYQMINITNLVLKFCYLCLKRVHPTVEEPTSAEVL